MRRTRFEELCEIVERECQAELARSGAYSTGSGTSEIRLSERFTGWIGLPSKELTGRSGVLALVRPNVGVRDNEVAGLSAELSRLSGSAGVPQGLNVLQNLDALIPERGSIPPGWVASKEDAGSVARKIAEDIVFAGFPFMRRLVVPEVFFEEFKRNPRRLVWLRESAVTYALYRDPEGAKRTLQRLARPLSQNPTVWADGDASAVKFIEAFAAHFGTDLQIANWPVRETPPTRKTAN